MGSANIRPHNHRASRAISAKPPGVANDPFGPPGKNDHRNRATGAAPAEEPRLVAATGDGRAAAAKRLLREIYGASREQPPGPRYLRRAASAESHCQADQLNASDRRLLHAPGLDRKSRGFLSPAGLVRACLGAARPGQLKVGRARIVLSAEDAAAIRTIIRFWGGE